MTTKEKTLKNKANKLALKPKEIIVLTNEVGNRHLRKQQIKKAEWVTKNLSKMGLTPRNTEKENLGNRVERRLKAGINKK